MLDLSIDLPRLHYSMSGIKITPLNILQDILSHYPLTYKSKWHHVKDNLLEEYATIRLNDRNLKWQRYWGKKASYVGQSYLHSFQNMHIFKYSNKDVSQCKT